MLQIANRRIEKYGSDPFVSGRPLVQIRLGAPAFSRSYEKKRQRGNQTGQHLG